MARAKKEEVVSLSIQDTLKKLDKKFERSVSVDFDKKVSNSENVIPTDVISIDYELLGIGGFQFGKVYQVKGWPGTSKSTLCGFLSRGCQKKGRVVVYIDSEHAVDINYFKALGVKFDETFILIQPDNAEEGFIAALDLMDTGQVGLLILDSDTMLIPKSVMDAEPGTQTIGKKAKFNSETYPKIKVSANRNNTCVIAICQYRVNPGQMFGDNRVVPGGFAVEFIADVIMETSKKSVRANDEVDGLETTLKTSKNKMYRPYTRAEVDTVFGIGFDILKDYITLGNKYKVWTLRSNVIKFNDAAYQEKDFMDMLKDNDEFRETVKLEIIKRINENKDSKIDSLPDGELPEDTIN